MFQLSRLIIERVHHLGAVDGYSGEVIANIVKNL